jgi:hypothetical protein
MRREVREWYGNALWAVLFFLIFLLLAVQLAYAQGAPCGPTGQVEKRIFDEYGESLIGAGIAQQGGGIIFILANPITGTFSVLVRKNGLSCIMTGGTGYAIQDPPIPGVKL